MQAKTARPAKPAGARRKLTRAERKQIEAVVRQAKGDGKAHTVQDSIPFRNMFPDGLCRLEGGAFSKTIAFEDVNYRLASPEDQRDIFEHLCDFYNGYDPTIGAVSYTHLPDPPAVRPALRLMSASRPHGRPRHTGPSGKTC